VGEREGALVSPLEASSTASLRLEIKQHLMSHLISFHKHCNLRAAVYEYVYVGVRCMLPSGVLVVYLGI
jgi:hypothetical protein